MLTCTDPDRIDSAAFRQTWAARVRCDWAEKRKAKALDRFWLLGGWGGHRKKLQPGELGPRQEELLSYLIGLAPVGSTIEVNRKQLLQDLGFSEPKSFYSALNKLIGGKYVKRISPGNAGTTGILVVLKRGGL